MGVIHKKIPIKKFEMEELHNLTQFSPELVTLFYSYYKKFSKILKDDGLIDYPEFLLSLNLTDNIFSKHLFSGFDLNKDNFINFREFLKFFGIFQNGKPFNKIEICFRLFSNSNTKLIEKDMLINILNEAIQMNQTLKEFVSLNDVENIVGETYKKYEKIIIENNNNNNNNNLSNFINSKDDEIEINHSRTTNFITNKNIHNNFFLNNHNNNHNNNLLSLNLNSSKESGITPTNNKNKNAIIQETGTFFLGNNITNNNNNNNNNNNDSNIINLNYNNNNNNSNLNHNYNNSHSNQSSIINIPDNSNNNNLINISSSYANFDYNNNIGVNQNINFEAFLEIITSEPSILDWLNINIEKLIYFNKNSNNIFCCFS